MKNTKASTPKYLPLVLAISAMAVTSGCDESALNALAESASRPSYEPYSGVHPHRAESDYYGSGYYPYSVAPDHVGDSQRREHAYDVAYRVAQDDFHHGRPNHMDQHRELFDSVTHNAFRDGYKAGYAAARRKAKGQ